MFRNGQPAHPDAPTESVAPAAPAPDASEFQFLTMDDIASRATPTQAARPTPPPAPPVAAPAPTPQPATTPVQPLAAEPSTTPPPVAAAPTVTAPTAAAAPAPEPTPAPVMPAEPLPPAPEGHISASGAAAQISELLRAAHDTAARLRSHAEVEVKRTVDAARAEVQAHKQNQMRVLDAEQAAAEQLHAEIVHNARLAATEVRNRAEEEAAEIKAAAQAVLAQAAAHAHAAKALVAHNLAEIEAAKHETAARGAELIGAGRHMIATVEGLDDNLSDRLVHTDQVIEWAQEATRVAS